MTKVANSGTISTTFSHILVKGGTLTIGNKLETTGWFVVAFLSGVLTFMIAYIVITPKSTARYYPVYIAQPMLAQKVSSVPTNTVDSQPVFEKPVISVIGHKKPNSGYHLKLIKSKLLLKLYQDDTVISQYPIAIGRNETDHRTPTGYGKIKEIGFQPVWRPGPTARQENPQLRAVEPPYNNGENPNNALGDVKFVLSGKDFDDTPWQDWFYIHGTNDPSSIGTRVSLMCVHMQNNDIMSLAAQVKIGMPVVIVEDE